MRQFVDSVVFLEICWSCVPWLCRRRGFEGTHSFCHETGANQWYEFGIELGYNHPQVRASTHGIDMAESKLHVLINQKHAELGRERLTDRLLNACKNIPYPIYEAVWSDIRPV